jgi:hypothetical protein
LQEQCDASSPRAADTGGAWVHAPPQEKPKRQGDLGRFLLLSLSALAVGGNVTCKVKKTQQAVVFIFSFFVFRSASLPSGLPTLEPGVAAANGPGVWMTGSATSLLPFHFYNGGVVRRCHGCDLRDRRPSKFWFSPPSLLSFGLPSHFLIVSVMSCWRRDDAAAGRLMVLGRERV